MPAVARVLTAATASLLLVACQAGSPSLPDSETQPSPSSSSATTPEPTPSATRSRTGAPDETDSGRLSGASADALNARLIDAAWDNDVDQARRLIRAGADVDAKDDTEQSAYLISTSEGYLRLLNLTLRHGADVQSKDSYNGTGLIRAAERGHADVVGRLLQTDVDVDHVNRLGWTALHEAIILGEDTPRYHDTVRLLAAAGADISLRSRRDGVLPLQHARNMG
ncbi:MAG: ankyrin repeat domain-containing protein, partial [Nocardioidaceae bacterium]